MTERWSRGRAIVGERSKILIEGYVRIQYEGRSVLIRSETARGGEYVPSTDDKWVQ
jgi:hypothetical protein